MSIISNYLFKHSKKYQEKHLIEESYDNVRGFVQLSNLEKIPYAKRTKELCLSAYKNAYYKALAKEVLNDIPSEYLEDKNFCAKLVEINAEACLDKIPANYLTRDILAEALQKSPFLIKEITDLNLATEELFEISYKNSKGNTFKYYPKDKKIYGKCYEVASKYPEAIKYVPAPFIDKKLILAWIKNVKDTTLFNYIPKIYYDKEVYAEIVKVYPDYISQVPQEICEEVRAEYIEYTKQLEQTEKTA